MNESYNRNYEILQLLKHVKECMHHNITQHFSDMNLTGPQGMLIGSLAHHGNMTVGELSERLSLSNSTVSGILDRLEKNNCVVRIRSNEDRRVVKVSLTDEFKKLTEGKISEIDDFLAEILNHATLEELDKIHDGLKLLDDVLARNKK